MRLFPGRKSRLRTACAVFGAASVIFGTSVPVGLIGATAAYAGGTASPGPNTGGLSAADGYTTTANLAPGSITHVWLIILENKSYNSEFSGVNDDTYLWQTLPSEGALLQNYHGTGHTSMDNYITMVSGQAPQYDVQSDCSTVNSQFASNTGVAASYSANGVYNGGLGGIVNSGTGGSSVGGDAQNWAYGQAVSANGPNSPIQSTTSTNGCTYPTQVATLFDQFNQAGITWKGYAQDLGGAQLIGSTSFQANTVPGRDLATECGAPGNPDEAAANPVSNPTYLSGAEGYPVGSNLVSSSATGGSSTTLVDTTQSWTTNQYTGDEVIITGGPGQYEKATIASNTSNTLTVSSWSTPPGGSSVAPGAGSTYVIGLADTSTYTAASLVAGSGTNPFTGATYSANNPEYSDQYVAKHFPFGWFESLTGVGATGTNPLTTPANGGTNCDANHIANLDSPSDGLVADLVNNTVPNFSWVTPDNCSDGHDSSCKGNNLSGAFGALADGNVDLNDPIYTPSTTTGANCTPNCSQIPNYDPEATTPRNYTGGTYAADLFLAYYVPLIERSTAFAHGLIDVTFDEGEPSFVYGGNTFNNIPTTGPTGGYNQPSSGTGTAGPSSSNIGPEDNSANPGCSPSDLAACETDYPSSPATNPSESLAYGPSTANPGADSQFGADDLWADSAGESFFTGATSAPTNVNSEPTGPNSPLATDANGYQLYYGPGFNLDIDRPPLCASGSDASSANCVAGEVLGDGGTTSAATRTDAVTNSGSSVNDNSIAADDTGREIVTATVGGSSVSAGSPGYDTAFGISSGDAVYVGEVTQSGPAFPASSGGTTLKSASFGLIDDSGNAVTPTGAVTSVTLSGECDPGVTSPAAGTNLPSTCTGNETPDPLFDAIDPTPGGGDTGTVLISPYINPGTVSTVNYNHYDWLRTMEDLFDVNSCKATNDKTLIAGTVCGGLDSAGHLGYAAQTNLNDFGSDVFTAPSGDGFQPLSPPIDLPEAPLTVGLALAGLVVLGGFVIVRRRREHAAVA
jgi:hypothetical protein